MTILEQGQAQVSTSLSLDLPIWADSTPLVIEEHNDGTATPVILNYQPVGTGLSGKNLLTQDELTAGIIASYVNYGYNYQWAYNRVHNTLNAGGTVCNPTGDMCMTSSGAVNNSVATNSILAMQAGFQSAFGGSSKTQEIDKISVTPGTKRFKVYCSNADASSLRVTIDGCAFTETYTPAAQVITGVDINQRTGDLVDTGPIGVYQGPSSTLTVNTLAMIGRVYTPVYESITWNGDCRHSLKFPYDSPYISLVGATYFYDKFGAQVPAPVYYQNRGEFIASTDCYGSMIVQYSPGVNIYQVVFDLGDSKPATDAAKNLWLQGELKAAANLTPLMLMVMAPRKSVVGMFQRNFTPPSPPGLDNISVTEVPGNRSESVSQIPFGSGILSVHTVTGIGLQDANGRTLQMKFLTGG